jgi:hypothetical protein
MFFMKKGFVKSMSNFFKNFENSMVAATFAEASEHETARKYLARQKTSHKKILLATNATNITPKTLGQAVSICKRIGAMLEVLHVPPTSGSQVDRGNGPAKNSTANFLQIKKYLEGFGISYEFAPGFSSLEKEIIRHATGRRDIMLLILDMAGETPGREYADQPDCHLLEQFKCPVVLLAESQLA